jgi:6-phosphogluconolactonase (cycloisomerase 2 family)
MKNTLLFTLALAALALSIGSASASAKQTSGGGPVVFVQTNEPTGNHVVAYDVAADGSLSQAGTYATGGNGGVATPGTETDHLASQGSLVYDGQAGLLFAVNAGSNSVSTFRVSGDTPQLTNVTASGGEFPASIAVHGKLVYVLNSGGTGIVQGFRIADSGLRPIPGSARSLGLANTNPPFFLNSPGQVGFTPDGGQLIVTTKASTSAIDVFGVEPDGRLSAAPVVNAPATPVPFAFTFTPSGRLAVGEAGASSVSTYDVGRDGTLADPKSLTDGQVALCWITRVGQFYYVSNTGSNNVSGYEISADGQPSLIGTTGIVATTDPGPIDSTSPSGTQFLYVEAGSGTVDGFAVGSDGSLTSVGDTAGLPVGIEGIAST